MESGSGTSALPSFENCIRQLESLCHSKNWTEAEALSQKVIQAYPKNFEGYHFLGFIYKSVEHFNEAQQAWEIAIQLNPQSPVLYNNLANLYKMAGRLNEAIELYLKALALEPKYSDAAYNLANTYVSIFEHEKAIEYFQQAIRYQPKEGRYYVNLAIAHLDLEQHGEAKRYFELAIALNPQYAQAYVNRGVLHLKEQEFEQGFEDYAWRWKFPGQTMEFDQSQWKGESLENKTLVVLAEQGLGDSINFIHWTQSEAVQKAAKVYFVCNKNELFDLFQGCYSNLTLLHPTDPLPEFDYHIPLANLPLALKWSEVDQLCENQDILKVKPSDKTFSFQLDPKKLKVGISWSGNIHFPQNFKRSCKLSDFAPLFDLENIQWISLQKGEPAQQLKDSGLSLIDAGAECQSLQDTVNILKQLDVFISTDTMLPHLAGRLGVKTLTMLHTNCDWRWFDHGTESVWYPQMKLYRQRRIGQWTDVFDKVKKDLGELI
jgi:tetratricopeptide (TPR) repeat protein